MAGHPFEQVLAALNAEEARYLVVGGVAVIAATGGGRP
jgi:hypothetical protein